MYILSQVLVTIGMIIDLIGKGMKNKKLILLFLVISGCFYVSCYLAVLNYLPAITNSIFLVRSFCYLYIDKQDKGFKSYLLPMISLSCLFVAVLVIFYSGPTDLFLLASMILLNIGLAFKNIVTVRLVLIFNSLIWVVYNFLSGMYMNVVCDSLNMLIVLCALLYYNVYLPHKSKSKYEVIG